MQSLRAELKSEFRDGIASLRAHFDDRMDTDIDTRNRMHDENKATQLRIENHVMLTNGRVTTLEAVMRHIEKEFIRIQDKWHAFRTSVHMMIEKRSVTVTTSPTGENRQITMRDVYVFVGGAGVMIALGKMLKFY